MADPIKITPNQLSKLILIAKFPEMDHEIFQAFTSELPDELLVLAKALIGEAITDDPIVREIRALAESLHSVQRA